MLLILLILTIYSQFFQLHYVFVNGDEKLKGDLESSNTISELRYSRISECKEYQEAVYQTWEERDVFTEKHLIHRKLKCQHTVKPYIVNGSPAERMEFAHMALIGSTVAASAWFCGGTLISDEYVLSAAHCTYRNVKAREEIADIIRLGELDYGHSDKTVIKELNIIKSITHENYIPGVAYNDIALFKINRIVNFTLHIRPACLSTDLNDYRSTHAIATGWGATVGDIGSSPSTILRRVVLETFDYNNCNSDYQKIKVEGITEELPNYVQNISQICFGSKNDDRDTCRGDSGGPLQIYHTDINNYACMYSVIGITSFGASCGRQIPGLYTRVYHYLDWIEKIVWPYEKL